MRKSNVSLRKLCSITIFLMPALSLYLIFVLYPAINSFYISLFRWRGVSGIKTFIGLANFAELIHDPIFFTSLFNNLKVFAIIVVVIPCAALFFAEMLSKGVRGANFFRSVLLFPNMMGAVAVAVMWRLIYAPRFGILNMFLQNVGLVQLTRGWLGETSTALPSLTVIMLYRSIGFYTILFLGGILNISREVHEAAFLDGASGWQTFRYITLPLLTQTIIVGMIFMIVNSFNTIFIYVELLTNGGDPARATEVIPSYLFEQAFQYNRFGYGTSIGIIMLIMMFGLSMIIIRPLVRKSQQ